MSKTKLLALQEATQQEGLFQLLRLGSRAPDTKLQGASDWNKLLTTPCGRLPPWRARKRKGKGLQEGLEGVEGLSYSESRDWYFAHAIPNQLSIHLCFWYCLLGLFNGKWVISQVQACFHTSMGVIKTLSDEACFHNTPCEHMSSTCRHTQTQRLSHYSQLCATNSTTVFPLFAFWPVFNAASLHVVCFPQQPMYTCSHTDYACTRSSQSPCGTWHKFKWVEAESDGFFPLLSLHVDLLWVGDFPAYHTHCLCFVLLIY